jgi:hypothetical protein
LFGHGGFIRFELRNSGHNPMVMSASDSGLNRSMQQLVEIVRTGLLKVERLIVSESEASGISSFLI